MTSLADELTKQAEAIKTHADAMAAEHDRMLADLQAALDYGVKLRAGIEEYQRLSEGWNRQSRGAAVNAVDLIEASETFSTKVVPELLALPNPADQLDQVADNVAPAVRSITQLGPLAKANNRVEVLEAVLEDILQRAYVEAHPLHEDIGTSKVYVRATLTDLEKWRAVLNHNR